MKENHVPKRSAHLKVGAIMLAVWLYIAYVLIGNLQALDGIGGLMDEVRSGGYSNLVLLVFSVVLLALGIQHMVLFFAAGKEK